MNRVSLLHPQENAVTGISRAHIKRTAEQVRYNRFARASMFLDQSKRLE